MFVFEKEQYIHKIGGIKIGGNPGEIATALAGTIFYDGHKIVEDPLEGIFDKSRSEVLINRQDEMSDTTGNPSIIQVVAESPKAIVRYLDFVSEISDAPIIIDSSLPEVKLAGLEHSEETGLLDRVIYNSINISIGDDEISRLREIQHECAIILAFNPQDPSIAGRRAVLEEGALELKQGLLSLSEQVGVTKPLIDTAITPFGAGAGSSIAFTFVSKTLYGFPTGSGIHNAPSSWPWLKKFKKVNKAAYKMCDVASNPIAQMLGANFLLYGPIKSAEQVFPVAAMADVITAESMKSEFGVEPSETHPYRKLL
ncbi:MAG: tetrahydromethanopterin S-methyltransferase subunit H [Candidatus Thorarchaeota archaeon]